MEASGVLWAHSFFIIASPSRLQHISLKLTLTIACERVTAMSRMLDSNNQGTRIVAISGLQSSKNIWLDPRIEIMAHHLPWLNVWSRTLTCSCSRIRPLSRTEWRQKIADTNFVRCPIDTCGVAPPMFMSIKKLSIIITSVSSVESQDQSWCGVTWLVPYVRASCLNVKMVARTRTIHWTVVPPTTFSKLGGSSKPQSQTSYVFQFTKYFVAVTLPLRSWCSGKVIVLPSPRTP